MTRLTVREACEQLRCSRWTLDRLFKAGKLAKITRGNKVYVDAGELDDYIRRTYPAPAAPASAVPAMTADELADVLRRVARVPEATATSKRTAA